MPDGGIVHATARGVRREAIFADDADKRLLVELLSQSVARHRWACLAYCVMSNHFHLVLTECNTTLSKGMHRLNWLYAMRFNDRHGHTGHVFEGRFGSTMLGEEAHVLDALRYVVLNPVRAGICSDPAEWPWSSFRATAGIDPCPRFLAASRVQALFARGRRGAELYTEFVRERARLVAG